MAAGQIKTGIEEVNPRHALDVARLEAYVRTVLEEFSGSLRVRQFGDHRVRCRFLQNVGRRIRRVQNDERLFLAVFGNGHDETLFGFLDGSAFLVMNFQSDIMIIGSCLSLVAACGMEPSGSSIRPSALKQVL